MCCAAAFALANGGGLDTVMYAGKASEYDVTMLSKGVYEVVDLVAGRNGTDTLRGITYINIGSAKYSVGSLAPRNHAPVVTATSKPVAKYATLLASGLFSVTDSDGDSINQYQIKDATISSLSGHFEIGGVAQGANKTLTLSDTQMSSLTYVSGSVADDLWVRAYDGKDWSDWKTFRLTPPVNHAPVVTPSNTPVTKNSTVAASTLFSVSDSDSDAITQYQFKDASASITSGHFAIGGVAQASQTVLTASAAQLPLLSFDASTTKDDLWVRAFDGSAWSGWKEFFVTPI